MKERPILFSGPMVKALLARVKTQTRRVVKCPKLEFKGKAPFESEAEAWDTGNVDKDGDPVALSDLASPWWDTERLWVREKWVCGPPATQTGYGIILPQPIPKRRPDGWRLLYAADDGYHTVPPIPWRPGIHMPRWASRITLEITDVRVQRLQDISEDDALAEGIDRDDLKLCHVTPQNCYKKLWNSINGKKHPWSSNPWVWKISFKVIKPDYPDWYPDRIYEHPMSEWRQEVFNDDQAIR